MQQAMGATVSRRHIAGGFFLREKYCYLMADLADILR
jgi:hypothetical protein